MDYHRFPSGDLKAILPQNLSKKKNLQITFQRRYRTNNNMYIPKFHNNKKKSVFDIQRVMLVLHALQTMLIYCKSQSS